MRLEYSENLPEISLSRPQPHHRFYINLCSENKDTDQIQSYRAADMRLCFRKCKNIVFSLFFTQVVKRMFNAKTVNLCTLEDVLKPPPPPGSLLLVSK